MLGTEALGARRLGHPVLMSVGQIPGLNIVSALDSGVAVYSTRAAALAGGATDSTAAIQAALDTGKSVLLPAGFLRVTGGFTMTTVGQQLIGAGTAGFGSGSPYVNTGTVLVKASGTGAVLTLNQTDQRVTDILFDGNSLAGSQLVLEGVKYSTFERLAFTGQGGTDWAMRAGGASVVNLCSFRDLYFGTNYGHLWLNNILYSDFSLITMGEVTRADGVGLSIDAASGQAAGLTFDALTLDAAVSITNGAQGVRFRGLNFEAITAVACLTMRGTNTQQISIDGFKVLRGASTVPIVDIADTKNVAIENAIIRDTGSAANFRVILADDTVGLTVANWNLYCNNAFRVITSTAAHPNLSLRLQALYAHSGGAGTAEVLATGADIQGGNMTRSLLSGATSVRALGTSSFNTVGAVLDQGAADDEILSLKSSDVAHGMTAITDTDTYGLLKKIDATNGGLLVQGFGESGLAVQCTGVVTAESTAKTTGAEAPFYLNGVKKSGTDATVLGADANLMVVTSGGAAKIIFDVEGDAWQDAATGWQTFDIFDDVAVLNALAVHVARDDDPIRREFRQWVADPAHRAVLEKYKLVTFNDDGHHFVNMSKLTMLLCGAVRQMGARMAQLEQACTPLLGAGNRKRLTRRKAKRHAAHPR